MAQNCKKSISTIMGKYKSVYRNCEGPPSGPKTNQKCTKHNHIFLCLYPKWLVCDPPGVKLHLEPLSFPASQLVS